MHASPHNLSKLSAASVSAVPMRLLAYAATTRDNRSATPPAISQPFGHQRVGAESWRSDKVSSLCSSVAIVRGSVCDLTD